MAVIGLVIIWPRTGGIHSTQEDSLSCGETCGAKLDTLRRQYQDYCQQGHDRLIRYLSYLDELDKFGMRPKNEVEEAKKKVEAPIDVQFKNTPEGWEEKVHYYKEQLELVRLSSEIETVKGEGQAWGLTDRWFGKIE